MRKNGFGSYGNISAPGGASGSSDPLSQGRVALATKSTGSRVQIQAIVPCVNQLLTSTLVDNVFKNRGIKISHVSVKTDDMTTLPIEVCQWVGRDKEKQEVTLLPVGVYAKVFGILERSVEMKSLEMLKIQTVKVHMMLDNACQAAPGQSGPVDPSEMGEAQKHSEHHPSFVQNEEGKSIHELQTELCDLSIQTVKQAVDYLTVEGHIYPHCG
ncbi:hypothetical protein FD755_016383 [Muntiacus reevesi]|uniref:Replication protein A C-terminal domain-containing protein n=1 Tax=Muntiacus reevesi TaxID=9886 RepID=A0A5N3XF56_MUNRE|nr:hypothetical protein FD755_016383 [Muntiacus reevesi]